MNYKDVIKPEFISEYIEQHKLFYRTLSSMIFDVSFIESCLDLQNSELNSDWIMTIDNGKYGEEMQKLFRETPYAAVDAERELFICDNCGNWKVDENLSLYAPNEPEQIRAKRYGIKTVDEWGYVPYVTSLDLEQDYHLLKEYLHVCSKCGTVMKKIDDDDIPGILPCPYCGTNNGMEPSIMLWD